jgi:serine protease Do
MLVRTIKSSAPWLVTALVLSLGAMSLVQAAPTEKASDRDAIATARDFSRAFSTVAKQAGPAVVFIEVEAAAPAASQMPQGFPFPDPRMQPGPRGGQGTGFFISADGLLLTNAHVVKDAQRITVKTQDGQTFSGALVGSDPESDVALVQVAGTDLPFLTLADSDAIEVGEWVVAIGNPFGLRATVTAGIVSAKGRNHVGIASYENFIQTDAAINPGNSGGPMLNLDGKVVGINSAIYSRSGGSMGIGFAIPSNLARSVQEQLVDHGAVTRGYLGVVIQDLTPELAESFGLARKDGALVAQVAEGSPAMAAGLRPGDVLTSVNGRSVDGAGSLRLAIGRQRPGSNASFQILRDGKTIAVDVELGTRDGAAVSAAVAPKAAKALGLTLKPLTPAVERELGLQDAEGVLIAAVDPQGPAARAGLRPGALILGVNGQRAQDARVVAEVLEEALAEKRPVRLRVRLGDVTRFVLLRFD